MKFHFDTLLFLLLVAKEIKGRASSNDSGFDEK